MTRYKLERVIGSEVYVSQSTHSVGADGRINMTVDVPAVNEGEYVKYRVFGIDSFSNAADTSNVVSLAGPPLATGGLSTAAMWGLIGAGIAILLIILIIILIRCCCPVEASRKKRQATRKMRKLFKMDKKKETNDAPVTRYQPPPVVWQSATLTDRRESESSAEGQVQVEIRQRTADPPASNRGSERIYFGQEDIDRMTNGPRSDTYSDR